MRHAAGLHNRLHVREVKVDDTGLGNQVRNALDALAQHLMSWTSILDCRLEKGQYGLEMEIVSFPGRQLPKLPSCAKLVVRPLNPEKDVPFGLLRDWENLSFSQENH